MAEKFPRKYFDYVVARAADYRNADWRTIANANGINADTIDRLTQEKKGRSIFNENIRRSNELNISGSLTIYLDGEGYNGMIMPPKPPTATALEVETASDGHGWVWC